MGILKFNKPKNILSTQDHNNAYASNAAAAGTYVPNMSEQDKREWKAKHIKGKYPRIEIRKTIEGNDPTLSSQLWGYTTTARPNCSAQMLIIVRPGSVIMSANSRMAFDVDAWEQMKRAVNEAIEILS